MINTKIIYLFLGAAGAGKREIVRDLAASGLAADESAHLLLPPTLTPDDDAASKTSSSNWSLRDGKIAAEIPEHATHVFFLADGSADPSDQVEAFATWLSLQNAELGQIVTVVHCGLAQAHGKLLHWHEGCIHFSDMVLLNRRDEVPQKWISDFIEHFKKQHYPCLFELVKKGRVGNPALVLTPQTRRISQLFDELPAEEESPEAETEEEWEDPFLVRTAAGRRVKELPDIRKMLEED